MKRPPPTPNGATAWAPTRLWPSRITKLLPIAELDRGFIHPSYPQQVVVSYFQGGKICDFITEKWGWDYDSGHAARLCPRRRDPDGDP